MNPKCLGRAVPDTFSAKSADSTGLKMRRITRAASFDDLVGDCEQLVGDGEPECLGGLEIDHELELGRLYHRQVSNLCPLQNPAGVDTDLTVGVGKIGSVTNETTSHCEFALHVNRGHCMSRCQRDDLIALA